MSWQIFNGKLVRPEMSDYKIWLLSRASGAVFTFPDFDAIQKCEYVTYMIDVENSRLALKFAGEKTDHAYKLVRSVGGHRALVTCSRLMKSLPFALDNDMERGKNGKIPFGKWSLDYEWKETERMMVINGAANEK